VFREIINTMETRPSSPKGVFCSGVYYTRDNTYKDCYIRQECSQLGAFRTSTVFVDISFHWNRGLWSLIAIYLNISQLVGDLKTGVASVLCPLLLLLVLLLSLLPSQVQLDQLLGRGRQKVQLRPH
jgi:hypothetical protein